jgi:hypothetical protein
VARGVAQFVRLGLGHAQDLGRAAGGAGTHVIHLVLRDAHHLLQAVAHPVHTARDDRQLRDLGDEPLDLRAPLRELGAGRTGLAPADLELAGQALLLVDRAVPGCLRGVTLGEQAAEALFDLGAVEPAPHDGEGRAVEIRCHGAERSSWSGSGRRKGRWPGPGRLHEGR